ncbi:uncharacterized protein JN550_010073 [Neoarthrinium moseri]|uniref:uncharacterized protein n=1 Tax=Neoarthrinium moseri TaxID=1658444 RepID=UPI001FDE28BC|nr:uncharacterized protein JN550_010073 [Neoarthrinium moseri]KAI1862736.1 hypothetical protein JN550_010073 [Neoarthrinium moseri]
MSEGLETPLQSPESGVSPKSQPTPKQADYFPGDKQPETTTAPGDDSDDLPEHTEAGASIIEVAAGAQLDTKGKDKEMDNDSDASATTPGDTAPSPGSSSEPPSRKMSISSVTFRQPSNPSLPQGLKKKPLDAARRRDASPPHQGCGGRLWPAMLCPEEPQVRLSKSNVVAWDDPWPELPQDASRPAAVSTLGMGTLVPSWATAARLFWGGTDAFGFTCDQPIVYLCEGSSHVLSCTTPDQARSCQLPPYELTCADLPSAAPPGHGGSSMPKMDERRRKLVLSPSWVASLGPGRDPPGAAASTPLPNAHTEQHHNTPRPCEPRRTVQRRTDWGQRTLLSLVDRFGFIPPISRKPRIGKVAVLRFQSHVAFDNIPLGESTDFNPIAFTLNAKHAGYQSSRRSRTFMVGVDDNAYSDHALQWLLEELVDDGDEVICVRVIETATRLTNTAYQEHAQALMDICQSKNKKNLAISLVVEYAVGKLHNTFQHLIKIYQPSMLIVGTKGRSLDTVSGLFVNRSSFSKYCLQYSPVPVVVVRPTEKREKKRIKRAQDPSRQSYLHMLPGNKHEADSENSSVYELEPNLTADEEAHRVAVANGLPAKYDPTIKPIDPNVLLGRSGSNRRSVHAAGPTAEAIALAATGRLPASPEPKDDEGSESEYEEEFEVSTGEQALKKERLHNMEINEGAALKEMRKLSKDSIAEEESDEDGGAKTDKR